MARRSTRRPEYVLKVPPEETGSRADRAAALRERAAFGDAARHAAKSVLSPRGTQAPVEEKQRDVEAEIRKRVIEVINALPEFQRMVKAKVRTGEDVARAIPDQKAFLNELDQMKDATFFELNEVGQLVMMDGCAEPYETGQNFQEAEVSQTRIVYRDVVGSIQVMEGKDYFEKDPTTQHLVLSKAAKRIPVGSILMERGLPTLENPYETGEHSGEYARMNKEGRFDRIGPSTWTKDQSMYPERGRTAIWSTIRDVMKSSPAHWTTSDRNIGSRGVLRVNLNFQD